MKPLYLCLLGIVLASWLRAQTVTLQFIGANKSRQYEVIIDGASYLSADAVGDGKTKMLTMNNLSEGSHELALYNAGTADKKRENTLYKNTFQLRKGYDVAIVVKANGTVSISETKNEQTAVSTGSYNAAMAMNSSDFDHLARSVRGKLMQSAKATTLQSAFENTTYYFSTDQVSHLLAYITSEPKRLELAKTVYPRVVDAANYRQLNDLFSNESLRSELDFFLRNTTITPLAGASSVDNTSAVTAPVAVAEPKEKEEAISTQKQNEVKSPASEVHLKEVDVYNGRTPVSNKSYNQLQRKVKSQRTQQGKVSVLTSAFQREGSYLTTTQLRELITPITAEADRLTLTKLAYSHTADTANFKTLYDLFDDRYSQMEMDHFIRSSNPNTKVVASNAYAYRVPISEAEYSHLDLKVQFQMRQPDRVAEIKKAFSSHHYFTEEQIRQWLSLVTTEGDRLALAKLAYQRINDPTTFASLYDLFSNEDNRKDLEQYVAANRF